MNNENILSYLSTNFKEADSKISSLLFDVFDDSNDINISHLNELSEYVFDTESASKGMKRAVARVLSFDTPDLTALYLTRIFLKSCKELSADKFIQLFNAQKKSLCSKPICSLRINEVKLLLEHMSSERLIKLIWSHNGDLEFLSDTVQMMKKNKKREHWR